MATFNHVNAGKSTSNMLLTSEKQSEDPKYKRKKLQKKSKKSKMQRKGSSKTLNRLLSQIAQPKL